ncbi:hypothetical protein GeomeDRAFT_3241 [Geobacter metallireducens RCH3]|uniref:Uncharacterized protein n=1 Tax=Geobacter metallireducens (strain ATCC 53774 / DSM 7210 / GS-15) TaxID=269799 RepID=Q39XR6_GEOMG|nr:hypothetical protein [Geobacter metallireducens]ABB30958.1 hypothetical protein Gmet_0716 [Geobacter metallireducens GS-15]EHP84136.1 hypothetical protein GeomeDRAFT_3241 [Geobacter metallireducens RCH3]
MKKKLLSFASAAALLSTAVAPAAFAATAPLADGTYTITVSKFNSNGTLSTVSSNSAVATGGKLDFTLPSMPTRNDANFLFFELKGVNGTVVRQGFAPAPPASATNKLGINEMSDKQAQVVKQAAALAGSDDPILMSYLLVMLRSPDINDDDISMIAQMGKAGILGSGGFEGFLTSPSGGNTTTNQLKSLKDCLIYNSDGTQKTLRSFTEGYYDAVNMMTADEQKEMQRAGGLMGEIFIDAATCAGIKPDLVLAAHNAAGVAVYDDESMAALTAHNPSFASAMESAMTTFHMRISASNLAGEYSKALTALGASGSQVTDFLNASRSLMTSFESLDAQYAGFYADPESYAASKGTTVDIVQTELQDAFQAAFTTFQGAIASKATDISAMKTGVLTMLPPGSTLPNTFGTYTMFAAPDQATCKAAGGTWGGDCVANWPIPQTVMVTWLAGILGNGGDFAYTRDTTPLQSFAEGFWDGECTIAAPDQAACTMNGGMWTQASTCVVMTQKGMCEGVGTWSARHTFSSGNAAFNAFQGIQEDIAILEMKRQAERETIAASEKEEQYNEMQAKKNFVDGLATLAGKITGRTNATTPLTEALKQAIIALMRQPNM